MMTSPVVVGELTLYLTEISDDRQYPTEISVLPQELEAQPVHSAQLMILSEVQIGQGDPLTEDQP